VKIACSGALDGRWILIWVFSFETRPAFREAFQRRRCLVPVDTNTNLITHYPQPI
jgi:hypothetical protein